MASHRFILSGGHRNENRGGARNEINWTYPSVVALKAAIEARGGKAWIVQEEDGDKDPSFCIGRGLQNAAQRCVEIAGKYGPFDAYISSHYNGGASPGFHAIFPDSWGSGDQKAQNPLDVKLCRAIRDRVRATDTVRMLSWTADSPGVMSERETGVGAQGYRLGEFVGTLGFRSTTARVIIEASSIDVAREAAYINDPTWVRKVYCEAIVDALEDVFGKFTERPDTKPDPAPDPEYAPFRPSVVLQRFQNVPPDQIPVAVKDGDVWWSRTMQTVTVVEQTPRMQYASGASIGPDLMPGDTVFVAFHTVADGKPIGYSYYTGGGGTRIKLEDTDFGIPEGIAA